ncbi:MAG TPA: hypothetical protein VMU55_08505 [Solirubrobacteraceae bacterium]|nr:hypothetical protein [Solirubrobacteraceae bacterium]
MAFCPAPEYLEAAAKLMEGGALVHEHSPSEPGKLQLNNGHLVPLEPIPPVNSSSGPGRQ